MPLIAGNAEWDTLESICARTDGKYQPWCCGRDRVGVLCLQHYVVWDSHAHASLDARVRVVQLEVRAMPLAADPIDDC